MYTIPWFEEDINAKTESLAYLSTTDELKPATHPAEFCVAVTTQFYQLLILLSSVWVLVSWSLTSIFSTNMAISEMNLFECAAQQHRWQPILGLVAITGFVWTIATRWLVMEGVWVVGRQNACRYYRYPATKGGCHGNHFLGFDGV